MSNLYKIWQNTEGQTLYHVLSAPQKLVPGNLPFLSILIGFLSLNTTIFGNLFCICIFFFLFSTLLYYLVCSLLKSVVLMPLHSLKPLHTAIAQRYRNKCQTLSFLIKNGCRKISFDRYFLYYVNIVENTSFLSCLTENEVDLFLSNELWQLEYLESWSGNLSFSLSSCPCWL